ncbi:hypothetical protein ACFQE5_20620 [Pseudonocardia hispaniensis]|uniref:DUF4190 domain-containing protein n=1 Tax=Pseudonocardia hispaniensis TaxID=904933 RepID=A0ABW1J831_9PSEU
MSSENTVADRLLTDARKKTARQESPGIGKAALIVGIIGLIISPISILGWIGGLVALGLGAAGVSRPAAAKQAKIALVLGVAALVVATFFYTLNLSLR